MTDLKSKTNVELLHLLIEIVNELGWVVAIPESEDEDDDIPGLVIGKISYVEHVTDCVDMMDDGPSSTAH